MATFSHYRCLGCVWHQIQDLLAFANHVPLENSIALHWSRFFWISFHHLNQMESKYVYKHENLWHFRIKILKGVIRPIHHLVNVTVISKMTCALISEASSLEKEIIKNAWILPPLSLSVNGKTIFPFSLQFSRLKALESFFFFFKADISF